VIQVMMCPSLLPKGKKARRKAKIAMMQIAEAVVHAMEDGQLKFAKPKDIEQRGDMTPMEYLQLRRDVYREQDGKCANCGDPIGALKYMHLHHKRKRSLANNSANVEANTGAGDTRENSEGLCTRCHNKEHP
jgi:hypothetical protein